MREPPARPTIGQLTYDYPADKKFNGEVTWVEIDLGKDSVSLDHLISPEERLNLAMAHQ